MSAPSHSRDVAIVGMACIFPGAANLQAYWQNIVSRVDAIGDPPDDWEADLFYDAESKENDRTYCKRGGYLRELATFNPLAYGVMPNSVDGEPDQFLALRVAQEALADAGYLERPVDHERVEVVIGRGTYINRGFTTVVQHGLVVDQVLRILRQLHPEHTDEELGALKRELKATLPPFNPEIAPALVPNLVSGRIANRLDFMGPNYTVDAACASSHIAVERGIEDLLRGACDLAIVGGVHASTPAPILMIFSQLGALSRTGRVRPFDRHADGTLLGEGLGLIVLKRREDADRDGDRVYAVIKGVGVASDGRATGLLAPRVEGEELALRRAYAAADVSPATVALIEAHGTGTLVGDAAEIEALRRVFGARTGELPRCALGSVKSMISHLIPAAGIAGIIKTALALHHKVLPPTLYCDEPDPKLELDKTPFYINTETRPWIHGADAPRRAGVNAFGFGGINAHAVLEEYLPTDERATAALHRDWDTEVVVVEGESREALIAQCRQVSRAIDAAGRPALCDVAWTWNSRVANRPWTVGLVASSIEDLQRKLAYVGQHLTEPGCARIRDVSGIYFFERQLARSGRLAFVFPGEGSQYPNMLADLCVHFPQVRAWFDLIDKAFVRHARDYVPSQIIFPPPGPDAAAERRNADRRLWQMDCGAEAVFTASQALLELLSELGLRPDAVVGHSTGEYSALIASGFNPLSEREQLIRDIADLNRCYERFTNGGQLAEGVLLTVGGAERGLISAWLADHRDVYLAMDNCPHQVVLFGGAESIDVIVGEARERGVLCSRLPFNRAYHTPLFEPFCEHITDFFARVPMRGSGVDLYSCATTVPYPADAGEARTLAIAQWARPVRFRETIGAMYEAGIRFFVEVGPRNNLTAFVDDILGRKPHLAVAANVAHRSGTAQLNHMLAQLAAHGVPLRLEVLYRRRVPRDLLVVNDGAARSADLETGTIRVPSGLQTMKLRAGRRTPLRETTKVESHGHRPAVAAEADLPLLVAAQSAVQTFSGRTSDPTRVDVMRSHLDTMQRFLDLQQEVMGAFLAAPGVAETLRLSDVRWSASPDPGAQRTPSEAADSDVDPKAEPLAARVDVERVLLDLVAERTGYPPETIGLSLDLEADLGVDSIKRVEILSALEQRTAAIRPGDMDRLTRLRTLDQILQAIREFTTDAASTAVPEGQRTTTAPVSPAEPIPALPLVGTITAFSRGRQLVAMRTLDVDEDLFLRDHTLGRNVSSLDSQLTGLAVVPLTISVEMLAEAATALVPGKLVVGVKRIRAYRWTALDRGRVTLRVVAAAHEDNIVDVRLLETDEQSGHETDAPLMEGSVILSDRYPDPPEPLASPLRAERISAWNGKDLYADIMFHGPLFRAVASMDRWGENGADATLQITSPERLFRSIAEPRFLIDPVILDAAGQVVAFWIAEGFDRAIHIFPFRVEELQVFQPPLRYADRASCRARIELVGDWHLRSNIDVVGLDGRVRLRVIGWEDRRFELPDAFYRLRVAPGSAFVTRAWSAALGAVSASGTDAATCRLADALSREFLEAHDSIWQRVLAHLALSRRERGVLLDRGGPPRRRIDWLLGRVAAKDAVRELLKKSEGLDVSPADIEIDLTDHGQPIVLRTGLRQTDLPLISISHAHGTAVAVAVSPERYDAVGIDIEHRRSPRPGFADAALTESEQAYLAQSDPAVRDEWTLRLWCAKEAIAKALGTGMVEGPRTLSAEQLDWETGLITAVVTGELARRARGRTRLTARTFRDGSRIGAICLHERS